VPGEAQPRQHKQYNDPRNEQLNGSFSTSCTIIRTRRSSVDGIESSTMIHPKRDPLKRRAAHQSVIGQAQLRQHKQNNDPDRLAQAAQ